MMIQSSSPPPPPLSCSTSTVGTCTERRRSTLVRSGESSMGDSNNISSGSSRGRNFLTDLSSTYCSLSSVATVFTSTGTFCYTGFLAKHVRFWLSLYDYSVGCKKYFAVYNLLTLCLN